MALPTLIQQSASSSSAAAPSTYTTPAFAASQAGSLLVALVAYAASAAPNLVGPGGWTLANGTSASNTAIGGRIYYYPNNPGGITTAAFTGLTNINGIAVVVFEFANIQAGAPLDAALQAYSASSAAPNKSAGVPTTGCELYIGHECDLTGQAFTNTSTAPFAAGPTATSTLGATNVILRSFWGVLSPVPSAGVTLSGTLAGALACGVSLASFLSTASAPIVETTVAGNPGVLTGTFFQGMIGG